MILGMPFDAEFQGSPKTAEVSDDGCRVSLKNSTEIFTTGRAALICRVSQQTIIRCFDEGTLKGFLIPGSTHRRIPRAALVKFMKDNGIPTDLLPGSGEDTADGSTEGRAE